MAKPNPKLYKSAGFTLLELLVVLAIVALLLVIVAPRMVTLSSTEEPSVVTFLREQRQAATQSGSPRTLALLGQSISVREADASFAPSPGETLTVIAPPAEAYLPYRLLTTFNPDGTMTAAQLRLETDVSTYVIDLSTFSGIRYTSSPRP